MTKFGELYRDLILSLTGKGSGGSGGGSSVSEYIKSISNTISNTTTGNHSAEISANLIQNGTESNESIAKIHLQDATHSTSGKYHIDIEDADGHKALLEWDKAPAVQNFEMDRDSGQADPNQFMYVNRYYIPRTNSGIYVKANGSVSKSGDFVAKIFNYAGAEVGYCSVSFSRVTVDMLKLNTGNLPITINATCTMGVSLIYPSAGITLPASSLTLIGHYAGDYKASSGSSTYAAFSFDCPFNNPIDSEGALYLRFNLFANIYTASATDTYTTKVV